MVLRRRRGSLATGWLLGGGLVVTGLAGAGPAWGQAGDGHPAATVGATVSAPWPAERVVTWDEELAADEAVVLARLADPEAAYRPRIRDLMPDPVAVNLRRAFIQAERRLVEVDACSELYSELGASGLVKLRQTFYLPATSRQESQVCASGALAFTQVGSPLTRLCRRFGHVDVDRAALALLHEALHFAGLGEHPVTPGAPTSVQIDRAVRAACSRGPTGRGAVTPAWTAAGQRTPSRPAPGGKAAVVQRVD